MSPACLPSRGFIARGWASLAALAARGLLGVGGLLAVVGLLAVGPVGAGGAAAAEPVRFSAHVAPLLLEKCWGCHSAKKAEGGYRVDNFEQALKAGDSGEAGFRAGDAARSEALRRVLSDDADERMPKDADPLPPGEIALLRQWIEEGAKFDGPNPQAALLAVVPPPTHPPAPEKYRRPLPLTAVEFHPNGQDLLVAGYNEVTAWRVETGELARRLGGMPRRVYSLEVSPDGALLAVAGGSPGRLGEARLVDLASGETRRVLGLSPDVVFQAAFSPGGDRLALALAEGEVRVFETATGKPLLTIANHSDWVRSVAFSADGAKLATASRDKTAKAFDAQTGALLSAHGAHNQAVGGVAFAPQGDVAYSAAADGKTHAWRVADGARVADVAALGGEVYLLRRGGDFLFVPAADKTVRQFDARSRAAVRSYTGANDAVLACAYHAATQRVAAGAANGEILVWSAQDGKLVARFQATPGHGAAP